MQTRKLKNLPFTIKRFCHLGAICIIFKRRDSSKREKRGRRFVELGDPDFISPLQGTRFPAGMFAKA